MLKQSIGVQQRASDDAIRGVAVRHVAEMCQPVILNDQRIVVEEQYIVIRGGRRHPLIIAARKSQIAVVRNYPDVVLPPQPFQRPIAAAIVHHQQVIVHALCMRTNALDTAAGVLQSIPGEDDDGHRRTLRNARETRLTKRFRLMIEG